MRRISNMIVVLAAMGLGGCLVSEEGAQTASEAPEAEERTLAPVSTPEQALVQLEAVDFYATQSLALRIAKQCESINFDFRRNADLVALRGDGGIRLGARRAVRTRAAALEAAFAEKHGVDLTTDDLCAAGAAERREGTALSATLRPTG